MRRRSLLLPMVIAPALACGLLRQGPPRPDRDRTELDPPGAGTTERPLPVGTVDVVAPTIECDRGTPPGARCSRVVVHCPGIPDVEAEVAVTPGAGTPRGTVFTHSGGEGTRWFAPLATVRTMVADGFTVVQVRWSTAWETTPKNGILQGACRPATLMTRVFETVHGSDRTKGFCALGFSGGAGAVSYALAHYGRGRILDFAAITAGPPFARIDYGCAPHTLPGPPPALCPELPEPVVELPRTLMDAWCNTSTCGDPNPHPDDLARWKADSVMSPGADYRYPNTEVRFFDCVARPNGTTGGAAFLSQEIQGGVECFEECDGEDLGDAGWQRVQEAMKRECVPRHG